MLIALSRNKLLQNIDISKIDLQNVKGKLITLGEGEILYREGDTAEIIFLLVSGQINVLKKRLLGKTKSYLFRENDFFGHEEYFEETSRTSTAVALVDSYLIALNRDEMDSLIKQDNEILVNLKEPIPENFVEDLLRKEKLQSNKSGFSSDEFGNLPEDQSERAVKSTVVDESKTMDFFKSISDFSRSRDSHLIQPLKDFEEALRKEELSEDKIPAELPESTLTQGEEKLPEKQTGISEENILPSTGFDEKIFLNEDGIPKSEFELPEVKSEPEAETPPVIQPEEILETGNFIEPEKERNKSLNDALFQILSGGDVLNSGHLQENPAAEEIQPVREVSEVRQNEEIIDSAKVQTESIEITNEISGDIPAVPNEEDITEETVIKEEVVHDETEQVLSVNVDEPAKAANVLPEEYGALQEIEVAAEEKKKFDFPGQIISVLEKVNSSIVLSEVLKNILDAAKILTSSDVCLIFQTDWPRNELWTMIDTGFGKREVRFKVGDGLAGLSAKNGEAVIVNGLSKNLQYNFDLVKSFCEAAGSVMAFPVKNKKNEVVAVLELIKKRPFEFNDEHEENLRTVSITFSNAIKNAELAENLVRLEREFSLSKVANFLDMEIKRPMLLSKRYAEHLKSKQLPHDAEGVLDSLLEELNSVSDIVTTTANYPEKKLPLRIVNVSLNNSLRDFAQKSEQYVESKFSQIINELDSDTTVKMDVKEFYQCYLIIIKNACDAAPDGGKIVVSTKKLDRNVEIHIKDNGRGISDETKLKIFEPFFSEGKREGTGIGLAVAKRVVEAHNGTIKVESSVGEGADFIITLPIVSAF